jgi:C4-dicarboxylate transporter, DctM subunit
MSTSILIPIILFAVLIGMPLFVIMGLIAGYCYLFIAGEPLTVVIGDIFYAADKEVLLAIPLFILAGQIMTKGSISRRLIDVARAFTAPVPGGLGLASVFSCSIFAAISGSSPVTLIAIGSLLYPALIAAGYEKKFSMGLLSTGGTLGIIIPPSIPMIIFAIMAGVSVVDLFKAGIGPGLLLMGLLGGYAVWKAPKATRTPFDAPVAFKALKSGILSLLMPVIILGGIYSGFFTATESAAIAVVYALIVEVFIHREFKLKQLGVVTVETAETLGLLFLILILAVSLNKFMTIEQIPQMLVDKISELVSSKLTFILLVNLVLLMVGCFMDAMSAILVLAPLLTPMAAHFGIDPVHFGIIMIVNLEIGYLTPPIGINLFVASGMFKEPIGVVVKAILPYLIVMLVGLGLICAIPEISLFTVN